MVADTVPPPKHMFPMNPWPEPPDRPAPGCKPAPVYNPRMSLAGASRLAPRVAPAKVSAWILATSVEDLADHILAGVDLDNPPFKLFRPPPPVGQGGSNSKLNRLLETAAAGPIPGATPLENGTVVR